MDDVETKVPYDPTEKRRFEISQDEFSRERIKGLLTAHKKLKEEIPFYAGMTLFGSLSKGKVLDAESAPKTDIDIVAFIDNDQYEATIDEFEKNNEEFREYLAEKLNSLTFDRDLDRSEKVKEIIRYYIGEKVDKLVRNNVESENLGKDNARAFIEFVDQNADHASLFERVSDEYLDSRKLFTIAATFFYDIGGDMKSYRETTLKNLLSLPPEEGERRWQVIADQMKGWERNDNVPESIAHTFPPTLAEAVKYYTTGKSTLES